MIIITADASFTSRNTLRNGVRTALRRAKRQKQASLVVAGLVGLAAMPAGAGPFPAEVELSALLTANGGGGSAGMALNGVDIVDSAGNALGAAGDVNGDGIGDLIVGAKGADPGGRNEGGIDTDADGIPDATDNCTLIANADQCDTDGDMFGNRCDPDLNNNDVVNMQDLAILKRRSSRAPVARTGMVTPISIATTWSILLTLPQ